MDRNEHTSTPRQLQAAFSDQTNQPGTPFGQVEGFQKDTAAIRAGRYEDFPPSLGAGSSSPTFESPRTIRNHNRTLKYGHFAPLAYSPSPSKDYDSAARFAHLSSSPPEQSLQHFGFRSHRLGGRDVLQESTFTSNEVPCHEAKLDRHSGEQIDFGTAELGLTTQAPAVKKDTLRRKAPSSKSTPTKYKGSRGASPSKAGFLPEQRQYLGLSAFMASPIESDNDDHPAKKPRSESQSSTISNNDFWIMGSSFGFTINDSTGRAEVVSRRTKSALSTASSSDLSALLSDDSDSEAESGWDDQHTGAGDAIDEFARIMARSKVESVRERRKGRRTIGVTDTPKLKTPDLSFFAPVGQGADPYQLNPATPKTVYGFRNTISSSNNSYNPNLATPPGAMFNFDGGFQYSTGMTPYLPRN